MNLTWATDIHLNFVNEKGIGEFAKRISQTNPDALVVTGDISESHTLFEHLALLKVGLDEFCTIPIYFVCGNHDYYHGSIEEVRRLLAKHCTYKQHGKNSLVWLGSSGVVPLTKEVALIGHDGWYDGQYANWFRSNVVMWDYEIISELRLASTPNDKFRKINDLAKTSARYVKDNLDVALASYQHVFVAMHVPPFAENSVYNGKISDDNWLPHFSSKRMGDVLRQAASKNPNKFITVLCGHSHGHADNMIMPNLRCITGRAQYRFPQICNVFSL